ncbi:MAG: PH domain-containing protein [Halobacteriota archaeon]
MNRLNPRVQLLWALRYTATAVFLGILGGIALRTVAPRVGLSPPSWAPVALGTLALLLGLAYAVARYRLWRYEIREDSIYLERGVFTRVRTVVPYVRIQHVDSARGPVERLVGLANTVVYTAGSRGADVRIPGLTPAGADDLRERLKRLAIRAEGEDAV